MGNVQKREVFVSSERTGSKEYITISDVETGEVIDAYWRERRNRPSGRPPDKAKSPDFYKVYSTNWKYILKKKNLSLNEIGFFFSLLMFVEYESNFLVHPKTRKNVSCREIAEVLGMDKMNVNELLKRLQEKGLLAAVTIGRGYPNHYILNTNIVFKGNKIKNPSEHERFNDSPLELPIVVKYTERSEKRD